MKEILLSKEEVKALHPVFRGRFGNALVNILFKLTGIYKVNDIYDASKHLTGTAFETHLLDRLDIKRVVENYEVLDSFKEGSFITVSNHPYGHIDGIIVLSTVAKKRTDFKMMVNWILNKIDTMEEHFIGVNPYSGNKMAEAKSSVSGVKECIQHLKDGHPMGFFPAGGISNNHLTKTIDREWQPSVLRLIKKARVPVIPLYISGNNSWIFRTLGFIDWRLRMLRLCHEVTNKKGKTIHVRFGQPISPEEQDKYTDIKAFGEFLKEKTYQLKDKN